ncbi:methyltransferase [Nocardiopsis flavescens]|uniref:methyltransferase n=1 Tax=Nocardiopsis flavescens TaxID=758803 RepID=UPI003658CA06
MLGHPEWFEGVRNLLDMGCGSGILGITAAKLSGARMSVFVDIDPTAVAVALANAQRIGIDAQGFVSNAWAQLPPQQVTLVLCNPPFQPTGDGGRNLVDPGLALHHALFRSAREYLTDGGRLLVGSSTEISGTADPELLPGCYGWNLVSRESIIRSAPTAKHPDRSHTYTVSLYA